MKKLFWIPLFVILTVIPMIAGAVPVAGEPVAGNAGSPTATNAPKYALKDAGAGDEKAALASYVKGAYNAVIKGINNTQDEINTLNTGIETYSDAIGHLTDGKATQDGTVATIKSARTNESIATSSVNFTGVTTTSISATASGNVNLVVPIMDDWETDSLAETPVQTTASFTNLPVENLAMSAPSSNTATLTKTGINGNVDVSGYAISSAYTLLEYLQSTGTQYIDTGIKATTGFGIEAKVKMLSYGAIFGSRLIVNDLSYSSLWFTAKPERTIWLYGDSTQYNQLPVISLNVWHTIKTSGGAYYLDERHVATYIGQTIANGQNMFLFAAKDANSLSMSKNLQISSFKIFDSNNTLVQNLIPVRRKSDNVLGMYDTVTGNFFTNAGTGEFVAGPELQ